MSRLARQSLVFLALLLGLLSVRAAAGGYASHLLPFLRRRAAEANIALEVEKLSLSFPPVLIFEKMGVLIPVGGFPVPLYFDRLAFGPKILPLLWLTWNLSGEADAYGGTLRAERKASLFSGSWSFRLGADKVTLGKHPAGNSFGLDGLFTSDAEGKISSKGAIETGRWRIDVTQGKYAGGKLYRGLLNVPPLKEFTLEAAGQKLPDVATLDYFRFYSPLGAVEGNGRLRVDEAMRPLKGDLQFTINLTDEGKQVFGGYLALAAQQDVQRSGKNWIADIALDGVKQPQVRVRPAGGGSGPASAGR